MGRLSSCTHPQGVRLDGHLLRGGAATRTVDHCTSPPFVPRHRTGWSGGTQALRSVPLTERCDAAPAPARMDSGAPAGVLPIKPPAGGRLPPRRAPSGAGPPCRAPGRPSRRGPSGLPPGRPGRCRRGGSNACSGSATSRSSASARSRSCSWIHCWTVPLPNDVSPTTVARFVSWRAPATISLADALPLSTRTTSLIDASVAMPLSGGGRLGLAAVGVLLPEDRPAGDELARHLPGSGDVAARIAPKVEDDLLLAGLEVRLQGVMELGCGVVGEASDARCNRRPHCPASS